MNSRTLLTVVLGLAVVGAIVAFVLFRSQSQRTRLTGQVLKVRTHQPDPQRTIALVDIRLSNPSPQQFMVRETEIWIDTADGKSVQAELFSEVDAQRTVAYYAALGPKYTQGLLPRERIPTGGSVDRSFARSAPLSDDAFAARKRLRIVVHDVDGPSTKILERP